MFGSTTFNGIAAVAAAAFGAGLLAFPELILAEAQANSSPPAIVIQAAVVQQAGKPDCSQQTWPYIAQDCRFDARDTGAVMRPVRVIAVR